MSAAVRGDPLASSDSHKDLATAENLEMKRHQTDQKLVPTRVEGDADTSSGVLTNNVVELCLPPSLKGKPNGGDTA